MTKLKLARTAEIRHSTDQTGQVLIDGEDFPWYLENTPVQVEADGDGGTVLVLRVVVSDHVTVTSSDPQAPDDQTGS